MLKQGSRGAVQHSRRVECIKVSKVEAAASGKENEPLLPFSLSFSRPSPCTSDEQVQRAAAGAEAVAISVIGIRDDEEQQRTRETDAGRERERATSMNDVSGPGPMFVDWKFSGWRLFWPRAHYFPKRK